MDQKTRAAVARDVAELFAVVAKRKELKKQEERLKQQLKERFPDGVVFRTGLHVLSVTPDEREKLDRVALTADLGLDLLGPYIKKTPYLKVTVMAEPLQLATIGGIL